MNGQPHLSVTQLKMYLRCPLQYFFRYNCGIKVPASGDMLLGRTVHDTFKDNYRQKVQSHQDMPLEQIQDVFSDHWDKEMQYALFSNDENPGQLKDQGISILETYQNEIAPQIQPVEVEREFLIETGATKLPLKGYIDLIDNQGTIVDHKITKRSFPQDAAEKDIQLTAYALAYRTLFGQNETGVRLDAVVRNKQPKIQQLQATRTQSDIDRFKRLASQLEQGINKGVFYPNEGFMCGICGYGDMCEKW